MNNNTYTLAAQERIGEAVQKAQNAHNSTIEPLHLLASILSASESINQTLLERSGVNLSLLKKDVDNAVSKLAKISGNT